VGWIQASDSIQKMRLPFSAAPLSIRSAEANMILAIEDFD
jgi:hypothetical protein